MMAFIRRFLLRLSVPVQKIMQHLTKPEPKMSADFCLSMMDVIQDGDALLSREDYHFSNAFIPGFWKHAAIYHDGFVIEAVGGGVRKVPFVKWMMTKDYACVLRPTFTTKKQAKIAAEFALKQIGKPYDYGFASGLKAIYCSELLGAAYKHSLGKKKSPFTMRKSFGVWTILPQDIRNAADKGKFKIIGKYLEERDET